MLRFYREKMMMNTKVQNKYNRSPSGFLYAEIETVAINLKLKNFSEFQEIPSNPKSAWQNIDIVKQRKCFVCSLLLIRILRCQFDGNSNRKIYSEILIAIFTLRKGNNTFEPNIYSIGFFVCLFVCLFVYITNYDGDWALLISIVLVQ